MTTILLLFFLAVVMVYYTTLQSEIKRNVIMNRELIATQSVNQINDYLSTGMDIIRVASCTLDDMIREGKTHGEMLDFLLSQSAATENITSGRWLW